ncbi:MAG TPA: hypothetical protein VN765_12580 [Candidatus Acidoferrum sp.]|nr:hypothetical protein [Candidatus Acidoferrum sp.]
MGLDDSRAAVAAGKLPGGNDVQGIYVVDEALLVENRNAVFPNENEFGMRDLKLLSIRGAYCKRPEAATAHLLFQFLNIHLFNSKQRPAGVKKQGK